MEAILITKLHQYIQENNPDLLQTLEKENKLREYLYDKVSSVDISSGEEICMDQLTEDLRPSKYRYLLAVFEEEFAKEHGAFLQKGVIVPEVVKMVYHCEPLLEEHNFQINEDDRFLRYAVIGAIKEYLEESE